VGFSKGTDVTKKRVSAAAAKRRRAELLEEANQPAVLPAEIQRYVDNYRLAGVDDATWAVVGPVVRDAMGRAGYTGEEHAKKHCGAVAAYLAWRHGEGLSLATVDAMTHEAIDVYFVRGLTDVAVQSRGEYRSRLHNLASRVNPGLTAPSITTEGYVSVRAGYTLGEEAMIRRVALRQRHAAARRNLCAVVGFCGGGGLDPKELSLLVGGGVDDRGDTGGIWVQIPGERARLVVIRRDYEELVRVAVAGLTAGQPILGRKKGRSGVVSSAVDNAEVFEDCPRIDGRRLRTTWITWLATNRVPLNVLLTAAGLKSARTLIDVMASLPAVEPGAVLRDGGRS
jgi:hypothetical protein